MKLQNRYHQLIELDFEEKDAYADERDTAHEVAVMLKDRTKSSVYGAFVYLNMYGIKEVIECVYIDPKDTEEKIYNKVLEILSD